MSIAHTISSDAEMRKAFANAISEWITLLKYFCKSRNCDTGDIITFESYNKLVYSLITKAIRYGKPTTDEDNATCYEK